MKNKKSYRFYVETYQGSGKYEFFDESKRLSNFVAKAKACEKYGLLYYSTLVKETALSKGEIVNILTKEGT